MTKEETISKLYGLRAGLSLVVDSFDDSKVSKDKECQLRSTLDNDKARFANEYAKLEEQLQVVKKEKERPFVWTLRGSNLYDKLCLAKICSIPFCGHACLKKVNGKWTSLFVLNFLMSVIVAACTGIIIVTLTNNFPLMIAFFAYGGAMFGWFTYSPIICSILPINLLWYLHLKRKYKKEEEKFLLEQKTVVIPREREKFRQMKESYEKESQYHALHVNDMIEKIKQANQESKGYLTTAKQIKQQITTTYTPFLVKEDWKNIDLMIFYLQTGRADNLKEALILADRQRQTDAIVSEISKATATISNAINAGFAYVGEGLKQININLATLVDEVELQNALTRYSNTKIEELIKSVDNISIPSTIDARIVN
jgi:hypothetical protein